MTNNKILRLLIHKDSVLLIASLVFLWFTISLLVDTNYSFDNLTKHSGQIVSIDSAITRVKNKPLFKEVTKQLRLTLNNEHDYFTSITTTDFGNITSKIERGDSVNIYTKKKAWGIFGLKKDNDISHMSKGSTVVIDFANYRKSLTGSFLITLAAFLVFFTIYVIKTKRRYMRN